jgi:hypothetical protein
LLRNRRTRYLWCLGKGRDFWIKKMTRNEPEANSLSFSAEE